MADVRPPGGAPRIVGLLPVRNGGADLSDWLDQAPSFCDAVVALDDGSTDDTQAILRSHPVVAKVLVNPRRDGVLGWHDGVNRNRLLAGAAELHPDWIISIDSDERLDPTDAAVLRDFVAHDALPGCAYGFQVFRMVQGELYDPACEFVYRLFPFRPGQRFPQRRFDFVPVPTSIPAAAFVRTTLRIKHYGESSEADRAARVAKYREADPEGLFRDYYERLAPFSAGPYPRWGPRMPGAPVLYTGPLREERVSGPLVVALLPARNCEADLPGWFESVSRFVDVVVALDDGSTDGTGEMLRRHPMVAEVLTNPPRDGYEGWDDGANRNRLLEAAKQLDAAWVISIDADERIPLEDGVALRRFIRDEARPEFAYGFPVYRMIGDVDHYDRQESVAFRLFAPSAESSFADVRLHGVPVPESIPIERWLATSIRLQHLGGLTEARRRARWEKYETVDPAHSWERSYEYTRDPVESIQPWPARPLTQPVVRWPEPKSLDEELEDLDLLGPVLSVALVADTGRWDAADDVAAAAVAMLDRLASEPCAEEVELLLITAEDRVAKAVAEGAPRARVVRVEPSATPGRARNAALHAARGDYVTFLPVPSPITPGVLDAVLQVHERGAGMVSGTAAPHAAGPAARAATVLDFAGLAAPGRGELLPPPSASFVREALLAAGGFDEHATVGADALAARLLRWRGFTYAPVPSLVVGGQSTAITARELLRSRFSLGRATVRHGGLGPGGGHLSDTVLLLRGSLDQLRRSVVAVDDQGPADLTGGPARLRVLVAAGALASFAGAVVERWRAES